MGQLWIDRFPFLFSLYSTHCTKVMYDRAKRYIHCYRPVLGRRARKDHPECGLDLLVDLCCVSVCVNLCVSE